MLASKFASFEKVAKGIERFAETLAGPGKRAEPSKASVEFDVEFSELMALFREWLYDGEHENHIGVE